MINAYLLDIVKALSEKERLEAKVFLRSPYFNRESNAGDIVAFYDAILEAAPEFRDEQLDKDDLYRAIYPDKPLIGGKIDKLSTELKKLLRLFVITQEYMAETKDNDQEVVWISWLRKQNLEERFSHAVAKMKKMKTPESIGAFQLMLKISREEFEWKVNHNQYLGDLSIPELLFQLDRYYHTYRMDLSNRLLLQQKVAKIDLTASLRTHAFNMEASSALWAVLKRINVLLEKTSPSPSDVQECADMLLKSHDAIAKDELVIYAPYLRNLCTLLIDSGQLEFIPVLHQIHRNSLVEGNLLLSGKMESNTYLNVVQVAIRAKEVNWAKSFTESYKDLLIGGDPDNYYYAFSMASCLFSEGNYESAIDIIPQEISSNFYQLMTRRLELKIYFEMNSELLTYKLDAFRKFIERTAPKSISDNLRTMNLNFINILYQIVQSPPKDKSRAEKIVQRIEEKKLLAERSWLLEKAAGLK